MFNFRKKPVPNTVRFYEEEKESFVSRFSKFHIFVAVALIAVILIVGVIFFANFNNNALGMFVNASSKNFDCGSFDYHVTATLNGEPHMEYDGAIEFDLNDQLLESSYHAQYVDYEYDAVVYSKQAKAYRGNYYGGKWSVEDYTERALDFFDFYRDYRKHNFDAGATVRFTGTNEMFNAPQLEVAVDAIIEDLSSVNGLRNVLNAKISTAENGTTVMFTPQLEQVFGIILKHIGSAYTSANEFSKFKDIIEQSMGNLSNADCVITYTIDKNGYLSDLQIKYIVNEDEYIIEVEMSNFKEAEVSIDQGFLDAASIEE